MHRLQWWWRVYIKKEKREGYRQKKYGDKFGKLLEIAPKQPIGNIGQLVKAQAPTAVVVDSDGLGISGRDKMVAISRSKSIVWKMPFVKENVLPVKS